MRSRAGKGCTDSSLGRRFCHPLRRRTFLLKGAVSTKTKRTKERAPASVFSKTHAKSWTQVSQKVCDPTTQDRGLLFRRVSLLAASSAGRMTGLGGTFPGGHSQLQ